jgi:hypothetical protein
MGPYSLSVVLVISTRKQGPRFSLDRQKSLIGMVLIGFSVVTRYLEIWYIKMWDTVFPAMQLVTLLCLMPMGTFSFTNGQDQVGCKKEQH